MKPPIVPPCMNRHICIDVDVFEEIRERKWDTVYRVIRATLQYNHVPRKIYKTRHGIHVYLPYPCIPRKQLPIRAVFGDDYERMFIDEWKEKQGMITNICFKTSEEKEITADEVFTELERAMEG